MSQVLVDDQDPRVIYTGAWEHDAATAEYDRTKSGASPAGLTASLNFTGRIHRSSSKLPKFTPDGQEAVSLCLVPRALLTLMANLRQHMPSTERWSQPTRLLPLPLAVLPPTPHSSSPRLFPMATTL